MSLEGPRSGGALRERAPPVRRGAAAFAAADQPFVLGWDAWDGALAWLAEDADFADEDRDDFEAGFMPRKP